ncbi:MAG: hypothetical protein ACTHXC_00430 [Brachybacterium sp.]
MTLCYPADTDWSCKFNEAKLDELRNDPVTLARLERSEMLAWYSLASLCAYQVGVCPTVVRPCAVGCIPGGTWVTAVAGSTSGAGMPSMNIGGSFNPHISGGVWLNSCGCRSSKDCSCSSIDEVILPGPVGSIESVEIDGVTIDPTLYRVDNGNRLVAVSDELVWPSCQNMSAPAGDPDTFIVTYYRGAAPNDMTRAAAGVLAAEFYDACSGKNCRLPRGVTNVARNGVTYEVESHLFESGSTGIPEVDAVIRIYNPYRMKSAPRILSPDGPRSPRRQTWGVR